MNIKIDELKQRVVKTLSKNLSSEEAGRAAEYLIWAEMSGISTQGILKLTGSNPLQDIKPTGKISIEKDTKLSQLINANNHAGIYASQLATDAAIEKAAAHGFGLVGVHNFFSSNGAQAYYVERIANEGLIGVVCSRSPAATNGFGGIEPLFGTNPIGFAFPTNNEPLVFDMATSAMTFYGLILAKAKGQKIPENMAVDSEGNPTTDPEKAMGGALLPFDRSYKGAGLAMIVELLAGPLVRSAWIDNKSFEEEWGSLFIAIDPELLVDKNQFKNQVEDLVKKIKSSKVKAGSIRLPGERAHKSYQTAKKSGEIEIDEAVLKEVGYV